MSSEQGRAPILEALAAVQSRKPHTYGAPGHHAGRGATRDVTKLIGKSVFAADVLTLKGVDDRGESKQVRHHAELLAAQAWGADTCYFSSNGSTLSAQAALLACAAPGDTVLLARNAHKSALAACIYAGLELVPLDPDFDRDWGIEHGVSVAELERKLDAHPQAKAVFVVSPTYFGITSDIAGLAAAAHARGVPLIVDEAWGALYPFSSQLPEPAIRLGADLAVTSVHKTLGALTQGSLMLWRSALVPADRLKQSYDLLESTSPSIPIFASIDGTRRDHALHGERKLGALVRRVMRVRQQLAKIPGLRVMDDAVLNAAGAFGWDPTKILIDVAGLGISGFAADDWLEAQRTLTVGLSDPHKLLAVFGTGSGFRDAHAFVSAIAALAEAAGRGKVQGPPIPPDLPALDELRTEFVMRPAEAFFRAAEAVPVAAAAGRVMAELVSPYPPGIPRLLPGERITPAHVRFLVAERTATAYAPDPDDSSLRTVRVVRDA